MKEKWKQYKETNYEVSNMGKVRNKETKKEIKLSKKGKREHDYLKVHIYSNGKQMIKSVHRLVLETFIGENDKEIDHINGIRDDNRLENLEYVTREENYSRHISNGGNNKRKPVKSINLETGEEKIYKSLYQASKYLKKEYCLKSTIDQICYRITQNIKGKSNSLYHCKWEKL